MFSNKNILITGGTGSFGSEFVRNLLKNLNQRLLYFLEEKIGREKCKKVYQIIKFKIFYWRC